MSKRARMSATKRAVGPGSAVCIDASLVELIIKRLVPSGG